MNLRIPLLLATLFSASTAAALEQVSFERDGKPTHLEGKIVVEAEDGGLMLLDREGVLWAVQPNEITRRERDGVPFAPYEKEELAKKLLERMPSGSRRLVTAHYVICYNTSKAYAQWCGALYERLYRGFYTYWTQRGFEIHEPEMPLVALVFASQQSYKQYATGELGEANASIISYGYYSLQTNRITTYDLTGIERSRQPLSRLASASHVNRILAQPRAERNVATIVHEATHQLAYNSGLHARYADVPLWVSEGIAIYFETPDLRSSRGWRTIGGINRVRLAEFRSYLKRRPKESLATLLTDHTRFRSRLTATDAYAEAWALNYYLLKRRSKEYIEYLKTLAKKQPLFEDGPEVRLAEFKAAFGQDLDEFDKDFVRQMLNVR